MVYDVITLYFSIPSDNANVPIVSPAITSTATYTNNAATPSAKLGCASAALTCPLAPCSSSSINSGSGILVYCKNQVHQ